MAEVVRLPVRSGGRIVELRHPAQPIALCRGMRGGGSVVFGRVRGSGSEARRPRRRGRLSPACGRLSRHTTPAQTLPSSRSCIRHAATPARPKAASTRRSGTLPTTTPRSTPSTRSRAPTTSATRTRSRSSPRRRRATSTSSSTGAASSRERPTASWRSAPSAPPARPAPSSSADITGHVLIHVCYEQVMKRDIPTYEEYFAWQLVVEGDRCQGVICWDLLNGGVKALGAKTVILATGGVGRLYRARPTPTPVPVTAWPWPCVPECRSRTWSSCSFTRRRCTRAASSSPRDAAARAATSSTRTASASCRDMRRTQWSSRAGTSSPGRSRPRSSRAGASNGSIFLDLRHLGAERINTRLSGLA